MKNSTLLLTTLGLLAACSPPPPEVDLCKGRKAGDLVITEFLNDPSGTDTGNEWIEVYNSTSSTVELKGVSVYTKKSDGTGLKSHTIRAGSVRAHEYFTVGDVRGALPAWIGYSYADALGALSNSDGILGFKCNTVVLNEIKYSITPKPGHARQLDGSVTPDAAANTEADWCDAPNLFNGTDYGSPATANPICGALVGGGSCNDNGTMRPIIVPNPGDLVITEVMANPKLFSDTVGEWFEVKANAPVDLNGIQIQLGTSKSTVGGADCLRLSAGEYGVFAGSTDAGVPNVRATFSLSLTNSGFVLTIANPDGGIDSATVPAALDGISWQLDPLKTNTVDNDDPLSFCRATTRFGDPDAGDYGSPGIANPACAVAPQGDNCMDLDGGTRPVVRPVAGDLVITEVMADPTKVNDAQGEWFEVFVKNSIDLNGLVLSGSSSNTISGNICFRYTAGSHLIFAANGDPMVNGYLPPVTAVITFGLVNSGGTITLKGNDGGLLDTVTYAAATPGASTQLDGTKYDVLLNDNNANFCLTDAGVTYGPLADGGPGDRGTPGAKNKACP